MSKESRSKTLPAEEWNFSEENLPDDQVELCFRHEYRREFYLAKGIQDDSVTPFLRIPHQNRTGTIIASVHDPSERDVFMRAAPGANNPFHENPYFRAGPVVPADVLGLDKLLGDAFSEDSKKQVVKYLGYKRKGSHLPAFFYQSIQPAKTEGGLVAALSLNTKHYGRQELVEGFKAFLDKFAGELGTARGPARSRYRRALKNLAIVRIRNVYSLTETIEFLSKIYLASEFEDEKGGSFLEAAMNGPTKMIRDENRLIVLERIRERRRSVLDAFRDENPKAGEGVTPASL